jgi:pyruvate,water dikinase
MFILKKNGFNVPDLFVISALYLDEYLRERRVKITAILNNADPTDVVSMSNACDQVKRIIYSLNTDSGFKSQIRSAVRQNIPNAKAFAVHSSTEQHDEEGGILTRRLGNFLNISADDVVKYIVKAFASIFQPEILEYYNRKSLPLSSLRMHVLVQEYNEADIIGTMYTSNPAGILNEAVIKLGSNKVKDGKSQTSTTYYYNYNDKKHYYESLKENIKITDDALQDLIQTVEKIKTLKDFNVPAVTNTAAAKRLHQSQERNTSNYRVGFAIINDKAMILEFEDVLNFKVTNPITLDSRPLGKDLRGVNLPLSESFTKRVYGSAFYSLAAECIGNVNLIEPVANEINNIVSSANGRLYYNITNLNTLLGLLPLRSSIEPLKKALRIEDEEKVSAFENMNFFSWLKFAIRFMRRFYKADKTEEKFINEIIGNFALLEQYNYNEMRTEDLIALIEDAIPTFSVEWGNVLLSELSLHICIDKLKYNLRTVGIKDPDSYIRPLLFNNDKDLHKKALGKLCVKIINAGEKNTFLNIKSDAEFNLFLQKECEKTGIGAALGAAIKEFTDEHGKFIEGMYRLEDKNFAEHPMLLVQQINSLIKNTDKLKEFMEVKVTKKPEFKIPPINGRKKRLISYYAKRIKSNIETRERIGELKMQAYLEARNIFRILGLKLTKANILSDVSDIFYMNIGEVLDFARQGGALGEYTQTVKKLIQKRREEYNNFFDLPDNTKLIFADSVFNKKVLNAHYDGEDVVDDYGFLGESGEIAGEETEESADEELTATEFSLNGETLALPEDNADSGENKTPENVKSDENKTPESKTATEEKPSAAEEEARLLFEQAQENFEKKKPDAPQKSEPKVQKINLTAEQLRDRF